MNSNWLKWMIVGWSWLSLINRNLPKKHTDLIAQEPFQTTHFHNWSSLFSRHLLSLQQPDSHCHSALQLSWSLSPMAAALKLLFCPPLAPFSYKLCWSSSVDCDSGKSAAHIGNFTSWIHHPQISSPCENQSLLLGSSTLLVITRCPKGVWWNVSVRFYGIVKVADINWFLDGFLDDGNHAQHVWGITGQFDLEFRRCCCYSRKRNRGRQGRLACSKKLHSLRLLILWVEFQKFVFTAHFIE